MMNPRTTLLALSTLSILALTLPADASAQTGSIVGIIEGPDGLPVSSAAVRIPGTMFGDALDELGRFRIHGVPAGLYTLQILRWGGIRDSIPGIRVTAGDTIIVRHRLKQEMSPEINAPDRPYELSPGTPLGFWGGAGLTATPTEPVLSAHAGVRYGFVGLQGSYFNVLSAEYPVDGDVVEATPGVDLYLYYTLEKSLAFYLSGGLSFAEDNLYGFGIGYTAPFNFYTHTGPTISFGVHTLRGVEVSLGLVNLLY